MLVVLYQMDWQDGRQSPLSARSLIIEERKKSTLLECSADRSSSVLHQRSGWSVIQGGVQFSLARVCCR